MDEQRVRTEAGWVGVEISKSRVRTPGKDGYGLYRVRGPMGVTGALGMGDWTPYLFDLEQILNAVRAAIREGQPSRPGALRLRRAVGDERYVIYGVPTRWTSRYQGLRNLGERTPQVADRLTAVTVDHREELEPVGRMCAGVLAFRDGDPQVRCSDCGGWVGRLSPDVLKQAGEQGRRLVVGEGLPAQPASAGSATPTLYGLPVSTVRSRQREFNAVFQREHKERRVYGKARYHARKLSLKKPPGGEGG